MDVVTHALMGGVLASPRDLLVDSDGTIVSKLFHV